MKILFLGTGEAFSEKANTSILIDDKILMDCGLTTLQQLMKIKFDLDRIKAIYISHFHADHYFGLPSFLVTCREELRQNPLDIFGPTGAGKYIKNLLNLAYRKTLDDLGFGVKIHEVVEKASFENYGFVFAPMEHPVPCMAISVEGDRKVTYTGDGAPTRETTELARNSDLLILEAYKENIKGHSSILKAAKFAKKSNSKKLALVHISRKENISEKMEEAKRIFSSIIVPEDLSAVKI